MLTILDTLARHLPGGDENVSPVMSAMVETLDEIKRMTGGHAHVVHHPGKAEDAGSRGHSSLPGALDTQFGVVGVRNPDKSKNLVVTAEKQKNHEDGQVVARMRLIQHGPSCVLIPDNRTPTTAEKILAYLVEHPGATKRELRELGNSQSVDREIAELVRNRTIRVESDGRVGTPHFHFLA